MVRPILILEAALNSIANDKTTPSLNQFNGFINQVNAFVNAGALTPEQGAALITRVNGTLTLLGG